MLASNKAHACRKFAVHLQNHSRHYATPAYHVTYANSSKTPADKRLDAKSIIMQQLECKSQSKISNLKKRSPTALLEALNSTIENQAHLPTFDAAGDSPHFAFVNYSYQRHGSVLFQKKGKEAANFVIANNPDIFKHSWESDQVDVWLKGAVGPGSAMKAEDVAFQSQHAADGKIGEATEETENEEGPSEEILYPSNVDSLMKALDFDKPDLAVRIFKRLHADDNVVQVSNSATNRLLAYLAFYRESADVKHKLDQYPNTYYFLKPSDEEPKLLMEVFRLIKKPTEDQYRVYIQGLSNMRMGEDAIQLYLNQMRQMGFKCDVATGNALTVAKDNTSGNENSVSHNVLYKMIKEDLASQNLAPNLESYLPRIRNMLKRATHYNESLQENYNQIEEELNSNGLAMSPSVWHELYQACRSKHIGEWKRDRLQDEMMTIFETRDVKQCIARDHLVLSKIMGGIRADGNLELAKRFFKVATSKKLKDSWGNINKSHTFYDIYLSIVLEHDTIDNIWLIKNALTPSKCHFSYLHTEAYFEAIKKEKAYQHLPLLLTELASNKTSSALVCQWFDLCVEKWNEFDDDTKLQVKNVAIVQSKFSSVLFQFKNPMFEREDYQNMVGHVRNRALQIIMLENDYGQVRERLEHQVFHGNTVTAETKAKLVEFAKRYPRLKKIVNRVECDDNLFPVENPYQNIEQRRRGRKEHQINIKPGKGHQYERIPNKHNRREQIPEE